MTEMPANNEPTGRDRPTCPDCRMPDALDRLAWLDEKKTAWFYACVYCGGQFTWHPLNREWNKASNSTFVTPENVGMDRAQALWMLEAVRAWASQQPRFDSNARPRVANALLPIMLDIALGLMAAHTRPEIVKRDSVRLDFHVDGLGNVPVTLYADSGEWVGHLTTALKIKA